MKSYRKKICIGLALLMIGLSGCSGDLSKERSSESVSSQLADEWNIVLPIYDASGNLIETIETYGAIVQTDSGIVYPKLASGTSYDNKILDYYYLEFSSGNTSFIGRIENYRYHAIYDSIYRNGHIFALISIGGTNSRECYLYDMDLSEKQMSRILLGKDISPYASMTMKDHYVYISTSMTDGSDIQRFDIESNTLIKLKSYSYSESDNRGECIRHIDSDENYLYLLRLSSEDEADFTLCIDICDSELRIINSVDVTDILGEYVLASIEKGSELKQRVSQFFWRTGFLFYENLSITRVLIGMTNPCDENKSVEVTHIIDADIDFAKSSDAQENDTVVFFEQCMNTIYSLDTETGDLRQYSFFSDNENEGITYISKNAADDLMIILMDGSSAEKDREKMYIVNLKDLEAINQRGNIK